MEIFSPPPQLVVFIGQRALIFRLYDCPPTPLTHTRTHTHTHFQSAIPSSDQGAEMNIWLTLSPTITDLSAVENPTTIYRQRTLQGF